MHCQPHLLAGLVRERTGIAVDPGANSMLRGQGTYVDDIKLPRGRAASKALAAAAQAQDYPKLVGDGHADGGGQFIDGGGADDGLGFTGAVEHGTTVVVLGGAGPECTTGHALAQVRENRHGWNPDTGVRHPTVPLAQGGIAAFAWALRKLVQEKCSDPARGRGIGPILLHELRLGA